MSAPNQAGRNRKCNALRPAPPQVGQQDSEAAAPGGCPSTAHESNRAIRGIAIHSRPVPFRDGSSRPGANTGAPKAFGSIGRIDIRSPLKRQPVEKECFVSVHGSVDPQKPGPGAEEAAVG